MTATTRILIACRDKEAVQRHYLPALEEAGLNGAVHLLSPGDTHPDPRTLSGLLLAGGLDIHPRHWNASEPMHPASEVDEERDDLEIHLVREAWEMRLPILGICRGEQILNVVLGGSLIQDVPEYFRCESDRHRHGSSSEPSVRHAVQLDPTSRLTGFLGAQVIPVNSRHHQAVRIVAPELKAVGWHRETLHPESGALIEAIEAVDQNRWAVGVQWHPENLVRMDGDPGLFAKRLFVEFVKAVMSRAEASH